MPKPLATPPGWYPDPVGGNGQRYWDGHAWGPIAPGQPTKTASGNRGWLIGGIAAVLLFGGCVAAFVGSDHSVTLDEDGTYYKIDASSAGTYETDGSQRSNGRACNWTRTTTPTIDITDMIEAGTAAVGQRSRVTLRAGEYFVSYGCKPWRKQ
jgi:hypothetical protein